MKKPAKYDFSGWVTRNNLKCSDGRTIMKDAFKDCDGEDVPLVWNHCHSDPFNILGYCYLENRDEGVYGYGVFNETRPAKQSKALLEHGDIVALSICANSLNQTPNGSVLHGKIREVSLVLAGANPGAYIENVMNHGEEVEDEAIIYTGEKISTEIEEPTISHADENEPEKKKKDDSTSDEETVKDVYETLTDKQKNVVKYIVGEIIESTKSKTDNADENKENKGDDAMKHNLFEMNNEQHNDVLMHSDGTPVTVEEMGTVFSDAKRYGSMKESFLQHGITDVDYLFPEPKSLNTPPEFIKREMDWVSVVMNGVHHTPFSRIKSQFADITGDEARARGYIKGNLKKEEVFSLLKRTTTPTTIYKKQKMDRDDLVDITDFDVMAWLKTEMRMMLDEEIARAILIGDGRLSSSDDKINEQNIRPIWTDDDLYTIKATVDVTTSDTSAVKADAFIDQSVRSMEDYQGSGNITMFLAKSLISDLLLLKDVNGRRIYNGLSEVATAMMVNRIVAVPQLKDLTRTDAEGNTYNLMGIAVDLRDYNVGADKGGAVNMFDDFDIDYNQQKYLIETRCSGALIKPYSAIAFEIKTSA